MSETIFLSSRRKSVDVPSSTTRSVPVGGENDTPRSAAGGCSSAHVGENTNSVGETKPGAESSDWAASKGSRDNLSDDFGGEKAVRIGSTTTDDIPKIPVVLATSTTAAAAEPRCVKKIPLAPQRERFLRTHRIHTEASKTEARGRFWDGLKPARSNSTVLNPQGAGSPGISMVTLRAIMKLKKKASVIQAKTEMNKYIMDPRTRRMQYWKNWMLMNIMFTVLVTPWRISFQLPITALGLVLAGIVNISFIVDTVLHFFLAVETEAGLLTDRTEIARRYVKSWFFLDLLTCVPYTTVLRNAIPASMRVLAPMRGLRLLKLLKVVKVYTVHYEVSAASSVCVYVCVCFVLCG